MSATARKTRLAVPPVAPERTDPPDIKRERFRVPPLTAAERAARRTLDELATGDVEAMPNGTLVIKHEIQEVVAPVPPPIATWD